MINLRLILSKIECVLLVATMFLVISPAIAAPPGLRITIGTFEPYYSPTLAKITTDTTISWKNPTSNLHSITHDGCKEMGICAFDSGPLGPNRIFSLDKLPPGYYPYHCSFHPNMQGVLVVMESDDGRET
jgi:plastocyanin